MIRRDLSRRMDQLFAERVPFVTATVIRVVLRVGTLTLTILMMVVTLRAYYAQFHLWPLLPLESAEDAPLSPSARQNGVS